MPEFSFEKPPEERRETEEKEEVGKRAEKERAWEEKEEEVEEWVDALGEKIDPGIKEAVVALNMSGFPTSASCEGHSERGIPAPWIEIEAPNEPAEQFVSEKKVYEEVGKKYNLNPEEVRKGTKRKARKAFLEVIEGLRGQELTPEFQKWAQQNKELEEKLAKLLTELYKDRSVPEDVKLQIDHVGYTPRLHNGGEIRPILRKLSERKRQEYSQKLPYYQEEMRKFTQFLRDKYFSGE